MTLQTTDGADAGSENVFAVMAKVVRLGPDGVGFKFIFAATGDAQNIRSIDGNRMVDRKTLKQFLQRLREGHEAKHHAP